MIYKLLTDGKPIFETDSCREANRAFERDYNSGLPVVLYVDGVAVMRGSKFDRMEVENEN